MLGTAMAFGQSAPAAPTAPPPAPPTQPILRVEAGGAHTSTVWEVSVDQAGKYLVTASEDKSARVWELPSLKLVQVLRPPLGVTADEGQLYDASISPDGSTIAVGGWTGYEWDGTDSIYLFDRESGRLTKRLTGLPGVIKALKFSQDGSRVAIGLGLKGGLHVFDVATGKPVFDDSTFADDIYGIDYDTSGRLIACSLDRSVRIYDQTGKVLVQVAEPDGWLPDQAKFSPDGSLVAVSRENGPGVKILNGGTLEELTPPKTDDLTVDTSAVAWSADGQTLYAAGVATGVDGKRIIRSWGSSGHGDPTDTDAAANRINSMTALPGGGVAFAAADGFGTLMPSGTVNRVDTPIPDLRDLRDKFRLSHDADSVTFGYATGGDQPVRFSVAARELQPDPTVDPAFDQGASPILTADGLAITNWDNVANPLFNGTAIAIDDRETSRSLAILPDSSGFLLGSDWHMRLYDKTGVLKWDVAAPGRAWGVNVSGDGRIAVAAYGDGTVRWHRMSDGAELLALYAHTDKKRWVIWTPSGYYDCSPGGEDLIGWNVNNGPDQAADFYPAGRFRSTYYRPDVIAQVLTTLDEAKALALANQQSDRRSPTVSVAQSVPPVVRIVSEDGATFDSDTVTVRYAVRTPSGEPITKIEFQVDGRPVKTVPDLSLIATDEVIREESVPVPQRDAAVSVIAYNQYGASVPASYGLRFKGMGAAVDRNAFVIKPKLYLVAVGVSDTGDPNVEKLQYAAKDARDFAAAMMQQKGGIYDDVQEKVLTDADATHDAILDALDWVRKETTQNDVAMVFISGHGDEDSDGYFFLTGNYNEERILSTALHKSEILGVVQSIAGKVLVFMDTCHSGNSVSGGARRRGAADITGIINELASAENGAIVFTACTGKQFALEKDDWGNGAFTKALLEGIAGRANPLGSGRITVNMLKLYISERVRDLTDGRQTPTTTEPPGPDGAAAPDFPVALAGS